MPNPMPGLTSHEVVALQAIHGKNVLAQKPKPSSLSLLVAQCKNPLIFVLIFAGLITLLIGHLADACIIFLAVGVNTILGFIQERKASDALFALKKYVSHSTKVMRDGVHQEIDSTELVPGDIVMLSQGDLVPADGVLVHANRLFVNEAILTGESASVKKEHKARVSMGTMVVVGQGTFLVDAIGAKTSVGAIALEIQTTEGDTPLQIQLKDFSKRLLVVMAILLAIVALIGVLYRFSVIDIFTISIAMAVSSIPEGLIVSMTVVLAIGMQKILKRNGLVKRLSAAETLGGVSVICVDKTGTLTEGKMEVVEVVGDRTEIAEQVLLANDLDDPIVIAAFTWGKSVHKDGPLDHPRLDSIPFTSESRRFVSLHQRSIQTHRLYVNGAPELVLDACTMTRAQKLQVQSEIDRLTSQGKRLIGFAQKDVATSTKEIHESDGKEGLTWVGMLGFFDPVRASAKQVFASAKQAGIQTIVITGDYANTSRFVMHELGMTVTNEQVITGDVLAVMTDADLEQRMRTVHLFARTTPVQKLRIVKALQASGAVVAMMGDGVNDAPALHAADIGIAVGDATDVAKESADLILLDSNFSTILAAIEEGRTIFENIRKIILYLMCDAFAEIILIVGGMILGLPLALSAIQILWINLVSDGLPNLALTVDPVRKGIMHEHPRERSQRLVTRWMVVLMGMVCISAGVLSLIAFVVTYSQSQDLIQARSLAFATLGLSSLLYVFSVRGLLSPCWSGNIFSNVWLNCAVIVGLGLQIFPFLTASTRGFFGLAPLQLSQWIVAAVVAMLMFVIVEIFKIAYRMAGKSV